MKIERIFKHCPFCGDESTLHVVFNDEENTRFVSCGSCFATGPKIANATVENQHATWITAQVAWNTRG